MIKIAAIYIFALLILVSGCGHKLQPDTSVLSAIQGNYPTAEFQACGKLWHGLGVCIVDENSDLSDIGFSIQGYYNGVVKIDSGDCGISDARNYTDSASITGILKGSATKSCVLTFTVSPTYPKQKDSEVVTSSFRGHLRIKVASPGTYVKANVFRFPETFSQSWKVGVGEKGPVEVFFEGCGVSYSGTFTANSKNVIDIPVSEAFKGIPRTCVLEGVVRSKKYQNLYLTAIVSVYYNEFNPLPIPVTKYVNGSLTIEADPAVAVISVGNKFELGSTNSFNTSEKSIVRIMTTKGRSVLGVFDPASGEVTWILR